MGSAYGPKRHMWESKGLYKIIDIQFCKNSHIKKLILCRDFCSFPFFSWQLNILMTTGLMWFKREKFDASLLLSCLPFPYPAIIQHSLVQKCPEFSVLNRWLSVWFGVFTLCDHHILRVHFMNYCLVRVISAARFENTLSAYSANFDWTEYFFQSDW